MSPNPMVEDPHRLDISVEDAGILPWKVITVPGELFKSTMVKLDNEISPQSGPGSVIWISIPGLTTIVLTITKVKHGFTGVPVTV